MRIRSLLAGPYDHIRALDTRVRENDQELPAVAREHEPVRRDEQLRGVGPLTASPLHSLVGDAKQYRNGLELAVALDLTPRRHGSGGKEKLLGISAGSDNHVRTLKLAACRDQTGRDAQRRGTVRGAVRLRASGPSRVRAVETVDATAAGERSLRQFADSDGNMLPIMGFVPR